MVSTTSMVASPGASIPAPFAMPPKLHPAPLTQACLGTVSVVMMASAASAAARCPGASAAATAGTPPRTTSIGSCSPISPVEHTTTSPAPMPSCSPTSSAVSCVFWKPCGPVHAFAPPELSTTARARPCRITSRDQWTGAAATRLLVNWAAAASITTVPAGSCSASAAD